MDVRSTIDRSVCLGRKVIEEEMCALIYLLNERLRGEILKNKKRKETETEKDGRKQVEKRSTCLCFLLCEDEIEMRSFIFFKQKKFHNHTPVFMFL